MKKMKRETWSDFPALELVRTGRLVRLVGRFTLAILVLAVISMIFLPWRQTAPGTGIVLALDPQERPQSVKSVTEGVVKWVKEDLREGSFVEKGELLLELEPKAEGAVQQIDFQIANVQLKEEASRERIERSREQVAAQRRNGEFESRSLDEQLQAAIKKWEQAQKEVASEKAIYVDKDNKRKINGEDLYERGVISQQELISYRQDAEAQYEKLMKAEAAEQEAYRNLESKRQEILAKREDIEIKNNTAQNKLLAEQEKLQTILKELSELRVKQGEFGRLPVEAPRSGIIQQWSGIEGSDTVKAGDVLFMIVPEATELAVEMQINGNDLPLIHEDDEVRLQFEGWPAVQFVGWPSVAIGTFGGKVTQIFPTDDGKGTFRILVTADNHLAREDGWPPGNYLRQGVRANGWVLLRTVPLWYEVWRQLNGFPPTLTSDPTKQSDKAPKIKLPKL